MPKDPLELPEDVVTLQEFVRLVGQAVREFPEEQKVEIRRQLYAYLLPQKKSSPTDTTEHLHHRTAWRHNTTKY